jgi:hypothetical protein
MQTNFGFIVCYDIDNVHIKVNIRGIQDFKLGGGHKKIAPSGGRRENFWVFRVKNHDFTQKNNIFSILCDAGCDPLDPSLGYQFRNLLTLIVENWSKFWY